MLDQIIEAASTPQGLIILVIAAFIAATLLLTLVFFLIARLFSRGGKKGPDARADASAGARAPAAEPATPVSRDPLERFEPRRQGKGPIGLARLRSLAEDFSGAPTEPTFHAPAASAAAAASAESAAPVQNSPRQSAPGSQAPAAAPQSAVPMPAQMQPPMQAQAVPVQTVQLLQPVQLVQPAQAVSAASPAAAIPPQPAYAAPERPAPAVRPRPAAPASLANARILQTLPFGRRPGLTSAHADLLGVGVEAVFFDPELVNSIEDGAIRLVPFLPPNAGRLLYRESDRETFRSGVLFAQPDAVIELAGGFISLEYKSKGGRLEDPVRWAEEMREKDMLQTVIEALVLSAESGRPAAPVLRTQNAVFFLRPGPDALSIIERCAEDAAAFMAKSSGGAARPGISAGDYASLLAAGFLARFPRPQSAGGAAGEAAHASMLR